MLPVVFDFFVLYAFNSRFSKMKMKWCFAKNCCTESVYVDFLSLKFQLQLKDDRPNSFLHSDFHEHLIELE